MSALPIEGGRQSLSMIYDETERLPTHAFMMAGVAAISTRSAISPKIGIRSSRASRGTSKAGTATLQNAFAAKSRAACSAACSAAALAASSASCSTWPLDGGGLKPAQQ